jgi:Carboxypeptidase regulatory-like domain/TonB dependent receptor/TonB-dependent Receptor Plug Domain
MVAGFVLVFTLLAPAPDDSVYGAVRDAVTGAPLAGVRIEVSRRPATVTGERGDYAIAMESPGEQQFRFRREGYDELLLSVTVPTGASVQVNVELNPLPQALPQLDVVHAGEAPSASRFPTIDDSFEIGFRRITAAVLESDPLAIGDDPLLSAAGHEAGAQAGFAGNLRTHGGSADQNLVLLDGLPVYGTTHMGGAASLFDPDAVGSVDLHSSVPSASVGGRLSSVADVRLRRPEARQVELRGAVDPTSVRQLVAGPVGRSGTLLFSARQSYRGVFAQEGEGWLANDFRDVLAHGSVEDANDRFSLYLLSSEDRLRFPSAVIPAADEPSPDPDAPRHQFQWSSITAGGVWEHRWTRGTALTTRLWRAGSEAEIDWASRSAPATVESELSEVGLGSELVVSTRMAQHRVGISLQRSNVAYGTRPWASATPSTATPFHLRSAPLILAGYIEERRSIGARVALSAGLRANSVDASSLFLEPRLALRYRISPAVTVAAGAARVHQFVQSLRNEESVLDRAFGADLPVAVGANGIGPARSDQISAEISVRPTVGAELRLTGYARRFEGLLLPSIVSTTPFADALPATGSGHAHGLSLDARYTGRRWELRANAGLAGTSRWENSLHFSPGALRGRWLSAGVIRRLGEMTSVRLSGVVASGNPASLISDLIEWQLPGGWAESGEIAGSPDHILGSLNSLRLPAYVRTDLGLHRRWRVGFVGRRGELATTAVITNLLNHRNTFGVVAESVSGPRQLLIASPRSLLLQVGWRF